MNLHSIAEIRDKILSLAVHHPDEARTLARKWATAPSTRLRFAIACDLIGATTARRVFDGLSPLEWEELEAMHRSAVRSQWQPADARVAYVPLPREPVLRELHQELARECLNREQSTAPENPFRFLDALAPLEAREILERQGPHAIAFLALFHTPERMIGFLSGLSQETRTEVLVRQARLRRLPDEAVLAAARECAEAMRARILPAPARSIAPSASVISFNDPALDAAIGTLSMVSELRREWERERELLSFLCTHAPELASTLSRAFDNPTIIRYIEALEERQ